MPSAPRVTILIPSSTARGFSPRRSRVATFHKRRRSSPWASRYRTCHANRRSEGMPMIARSVVFLLICGLAAPLHAQAPPPEATVLQNVRIFDGKIGQLSGPSHVLIRGNKIERISATPIAGDGRAGTVLVDGGGRTLMPGL